MIVVTTTKDGKRRYGVRIETVDADGRRKRVRLGSYSNRRDAERAEALAIDHRERGTLLLPETTTVGELLTEWLAAKRPEITSNTYVDYEGTIRLRLKPALGSIKAQKLTAARIQSQYTKWRADGLSDHAIRNCHLRLSAALDYGVRMNLLTTNPARDARTPRLERTTFQTWDHGEARAFLDAVKDYHLPRPRKDNPEVFWTPALIPAVLWDLLLREGMRRGEALGLRWRDVSWERGTVSIMQSVTPDKSNRGATRIQPRTKTRAGERSVRLAPETLAALEERQKQWRRDKIASPIWQETDLIVCTPHGGPITPSNVQRAFASILAYAAAQGVEIPRIKVHELRHTSATLLLLAGVSPKVVSERLGHASVSITLDRYSAVLPDLQQTASDAMSRLLG